MVIQSSKIISLIALVFISMSTSFSQTNPNVFSPAFSHLSGRYNTDLVVGLTSLTPNTEIHYTLDGTVPNSLSPLYTGTIPVTGDGNQVTVKAIAIKNGSIESFISSATYVIDYDYDSNAGYLSNLSWGQYQDYIDGDWFGYVSTPWTCNYSVKVKILSNGNYIDTTTSTSCFDPNADVFLPVFYYGITDTSHLKVIELHNILSSGYANGTITIDFGLPGTNQYELRTIKFRDEDNMSIEMWHNQNGPLYYYLTKNRKYLEVDEEHSQTTTQIYPNPTSDYVSFKDLQSDVILTNQLGQTFSFEKSDKISVSHLPKGIYFVQFTNSKGEPSRQKLTIE